MMKNLKLKIEKLLSCDSELSEVYNMLHNAINTLASASYDHDEIRSVVYQDNDPLDLNLIDSESILYLEIRDIQLDIIRFFDEFNDNKKQVNMKIWRITNELTQAQLAEKLGVTVKTINTLEKKPTKMLRYALIGLENSMNKGE